MSPPSAPAPDAAEEALEIFEGLLGSQPFRVVRNTATGQFFTPIFNLPPTLHKDQFIRITSTTGAQGWYDMKTDQVLLMAGGRAQASTSSTVGAPPAPIKDTKTSPDSQDAPEAKHTILDVLPSSTPSSGTLSSADPIQESSSSRHQVEGVAPTEDTSAEEAEPASTPTASGESAKNEVQRRPAATPPPPSTQSNLIHSRSPSPPTPSGATKRSRIDENKDEAGTGMKGEGVGVEEQHMGKEADGVATESEGNSGELEQALNRLRSGQWVNDTAVNMFLELLHVRGQSAHYPSVAVYTSFWQRSPPVKPPRGCLEASWILFPFHLYDSHWALMALNVGKTTAVYYDSLADNWERLPQDIHALCQRAIAMFRSHVRIASGLGEAFADNLQVECKALKGPRQRNVCDCGVLLMMGAEKICRTEAVPDELRLGVKLPRTPDKAARALIAEALETKTITFM